MSEQPRKTAIQDLVIDIDGIRSIAPPEKDPLQQEFEVAFNIGNDSALPFSLEEDDPIFQDGSLDLGVGGNDKDKNKTGIPLYSSSQKFNKTKGRDYDNDDDGDSCVDSSDDERILREETRKKKATQQQEATQPDQLTTRQSEQLGVGNTAATITSTDTRSRQEPSQTPTQPAALGTVEKTLATTTATVEKTLATTTVEQTLAKPLGNEQTSDTVAEVVVAARTTTALESTKNRESMPSTEGESSGHLQAANKATGSSSMDISDDTSDAAFDSDRITTNPSSHSSEEHRKTGCGGDDESPPNTPPSLENEEEAWLIARLDDEITAQEEVALFKKLDDDITAHEERYLLSKLRQDIYLAEVKAKVLQEGTSRLRVDYVVSAEDVSPSDHETCWTDLPGVLGESHGTTEAQLPMEKSCMGGMIPVEEDRINLFRATLLIPKYLVSRSQPFASRRSFHRDFVTVVRSAMESDPDPFLVWALRMELQDVEGDPDSFRFVATGCKKALTVILYKLRNWLNNKIFARNMRVVLSDPSSIELSVRVSCNEKLGATAVFLCDDFTLCTNDLGIWIKAIAPDGELGKAVGALAGQEGGIIMSINGTRCRTKSVFGQVYAKARQGPEGTLVVTLTLSRYADLSRLDPSKVMSLNGTGVVRRDGQPYSKKLEKDSWTVPVKPTPPPQVPFVPPTQEEKNNAFQMSRRILADPKSVEVDLIVSSSENLGASVLRNDTDPGLVISYFKKDQQLERILGKKACTHGACLIQAGGQPISSASELVGISESAKLDGGTYQIRLCFRDGVDLSGVDKSKLVAGRINPRRKNGFMYPPWTWVAPIPPSTTSNPEQERRDVKNQTREAKDNNRGKPAKQKRTTPESTTGSSPPLKKVARSEAPNAAPSDAQNKAQHGIESYTAFKSKYRWMLLTEYKEIGVKVQKANSSMWNQHKILFGENAICDDNCRCVFSLENMTRNVVSDFKKIETKKDPTKEVEIGAAVGFVDRFAPRFTPLLRKEYPEETPSKILQRLERMWDAHRMNRNFGITCRKECQCGEGWELVFGQGDPSAVANTRKSKRKDHSPLGQLLKKRKLTPESSAGSMTNDKQLQSAPLPRIAAKPKTSGINRQSYEVEFDAKLPLGAYFVTERKPTGNECKIFSVWEKGQRKDERRIHRGK
jgi:hypothetical protein